MLDGRAAMVAGVWGDGRGRRRIVRAQVWRKGGAVGCWYTATKVGLAELGVSQGSNNGLSIVPEGITSRLLGSARLGERGRGAKATRCSD